MNLKQKLIKEIQRRGGQVVDESAGRWNTIQLEAPKGMLWQEGIAAIRVTWPLGTKCDEACADALQRIERQTFRPMTEDEAYLYAED